MPEDSPIKEDETGLAHGWHKVSLSSVAEVRFSSVDKHTRAGEEPVRLCNYTDVYKNDCITNDLEFMSASASPSEIARFGIRLGDVMLTKDSETPYDIGVPAVADYAAPDLVCGYHLGLIRPDLDRIDPTFLCKQLGHDRIARYFAEHANGLTRYGLPLTAVSATPIWLPRLQEQHVIGQHLRLLDEAIERTEAVIAKLKQLRIGLLHDLLTCGTDENGELRDPLRENHEFRNSQIGLIPKNWEVKRLEAVASVDRGKFTYRPRNDPSLYGGYALFIQTGDVTEAAGEVIFESTQTLNQRGMAHSREFPAGTVAITIAANIGDTAILGRPMYFPDSVVGVITNDSMSARWVELCLRRAKTKLMALAPQSAQRNINLRFLRPLEIPIPGLAEQQRCSSLYELLNQELQEELLNLNKLKLVKTGLADNLLAGRIRVPDQAMEETS